MQNHPLSALDQASNPPQTPCTAQRGFLTQSFKRRRLRALISHAMLGLLAFSSGHLPTAWGSSRIENPLLGYTHQLASPFTLPAGSLQVGTTSAVGLTDYLQVSTQLFADLLQIYNLQLRSGLLDLPGLAVGAGLGLQSVQLSHLTGQNTNQVISALLPQLTLGFEVAPHWALFLGGQLYLANQTPNANSVLGAGMMQGTEVEADLSWAYQPHPEEERIGNVLSMGYSYNTTYQFYGVGISHHWRGLHVGIHYYPNATFYQLSPILSGGASFDIF